jgi:hypothetical protein
VSANLNRDKLWGGGGGELITKNACGRKVNFMPRVERLFGHDC